MDRKRIKIDLLIHDLKVPLAVVESGITLLLQKPGTYGPLTTKQEKVLNRILRNTRSTQMLVNDALELARSRQGIVKLTSFNLSKMFEETLIELFDLVDTNTSEKIKACGDLAGLKDVLAENGLTLFIEEELWPREFCMDEIKIKQILRNLLNNAIKYRKNHIEVEVAFKEDHLFLSIKDDGVGIPSAYHKKIFESYFYLEATDAGVIRGSGLGLAGVMVLVEDLGGRLFLESEEGEGAKFSVKLPVAKTS
jgi:signal transduction histidine kinase